jgi:hypothetical protein
LRSPAITALLLAAALSAGCTATYTYNHLDWLIPWYVDGYVDLTRQQRRALQNRLEPLLQWHREEELARYGGLLDRIERELADPVTAATVQGWLDEIVAALERTEQSMLTLALDFGSGMSDAQVAEFTTSLWERQREFEEELLGRDDEQYRRDSYDSLADFLQPLLGGLSAAQETRLRAAAGELHRFDGAWLEERALWLRTLEPLLQRHPGWQQAVETAYAARKQQRTPRYREYLAHNLAVVTAAVADVLNQMSSGQRQHLAREFDDVRNRLRKLAETPRVTRSNTVGTGSPGLGRLAQHVIIEADGPQVILDRNALVNSVHVLDGIRIHVDRHETIDVRRHLMEELRIGSATHHVRCHQRIVVHRTDRCRDDGVPA